jgi:hypothetical protein
MLRSLLWPRRADFRLRRSLRNLADRSRSSPAPCCRQQLPSAPWSKPRSSWWTTRTRRSSISMMRTVAIPIAASAPRPSSARRRVSDAPCFFYCELRPSPLARNGGGAPRGETEFDFGCVSSARRRPIPRTRLTTSSRRQLSAEAAAAALQRPVSMTTGRSSRPPTPRPISETDLHRP